MKRWDEVEASMAEAVNEIRTLSYLLHPLSLDSDGLSSTICRYVDGYANRSGLIVRVRSTPKVDKLPLRMQRSLFRIVQEALANVHRHACASHVSVDLRWIGGRLHVVITDNGRGVEGTQERSPIRPGNGIYGIRARARQLGGDLKFRTGPLGTRVHVVMKSGRHSKDLRWVVRREGHSSLPNGGVQPRDHPRSQTEHSESPVEQVDAP